MVFHVLLFSSLLLISIKSAAIDNLINTVELDVINLTKEIENTFANRCNTANSTKCLYLTCSSDFPRASCVSSFETKYCESCPKESRGLLLNKETSIKLANVYQPETNPDDIEVRELIYAGINLPSMFQTMHDNNKNLYKWMYYGSRAGSFHVYPGQNTCDKYDNRFRPWYIGAATGAKNFIMILDISGSMQN